MLCEKCKQEKKVEEWPDLKADQPFICSSCTADWVKEVSQHLFWPWGPVRVHPPIDN